MKKLIGIIIMILLSTVLMACANKDEPIRVEPDYMAIINNTNNTANDNQDDKKEQNKEQQNKGQDNTADKETLEVGTADRNNSDDKEFTGITSKKTYNTGNLNINFKHMAWASAIVCPDKENNILYYIDHSKGAAIYQLKDGVSTLLVDWKADSLYLWEDKLYFIRIKDDTSYSNAGDIYSFHLNTQELELVKEGLMFNLYLDDFGLYYMEVHEINGTKVSMNYQHNFADKTAEKANYLFSPAYNEYRILFQNDAIYLYNQDTDEYQLLVTGLTNIVRLRLSDHYFNYQIENTIYIINLLNGSTIEVDRDILKGFKIDEFIGYYIRDYIIFNDTLYLATDTTLMEYSILNGSWKEGVQETEDQEQIYGLFTDGESLYSLTTLEEQGHLPDNEKTFKPLSKVEIISNTNENAIRRADGSLLNPYVLAFETIGD